MLLGYETDIDRAPRFGRARRELERAGISGRPSKTKDQLLHAEVARVGWNIKDVSSERDDQRTIHRHTDPLEDVEIEVRRATFHAAFDHAADAGTPGQFGARPAAPLPHRLDLTTDPDTLFLIPTSGFDGELGSV